MNDKLLIIDPQNDFCDIPGAALPVAGADTDMRHLAGFIRALHRQLGDIIVTLDSHASVGIERTTFWIDANGAAVAPFTQITAAEVRAGRFAPRDTMRAPEALAYLDSLEARGRYRLTVWPVHCVLGSWGHNIHEAVNAEIAAWEQVHQRQAGRVLKGLNPMTEQYSAIAAEVPDPADPLTQDNRVLIERVRPAEGATLFVAGEALSHCVAATLTDLFTAFSPAERSRVVLLSNCMSPVAGFEEQGRDFLGWARTKGAFVFPSGEVISGIRRG